MNSVWADLLRAAEDSLLAGAHDGPCTNEDSPGQPWYGEPCDLHLEASKRRKAALRAAVDAAKAAAL